MKAQLVRTVRKSWRLGVIAALLVLFAAAAIPALAISFDITVTDLDAVQFWGGSYPPVRVADVTLYAPNTLYGATVTITSGYVPGDTLGSTACGGLTCVYTAPTLTISGAGTAAQYKSALNNVVYSTTASGAGATGDRTVTYSIDVAVMPGYFKCVDPNHYYYRFSGGYRTWSQSRQEALNYRYLGYTGYLVHINSQAENDCVKAQYGSHQGWIGLRGVTPTGPYNWVDGPTADNPYDYANWAGGQPTDKPIQQYVHMDPSSGAWYNVTDSDSGTKDGYVVEFGNPAEDSGQPKSGTAIVHVYPPADYTATKSNSGVWNAVAGRWETPFDDPFNWIVTVKNSGPGYGTFSSGQVILRDYLPAGPTYGTPTVNNVVNVTNSGNINCAIASNVLTCKANGAAVTIGGTYGGNPPGQFDATVSVTPELPGWKTNPTGGVCRVDPDGVWIESNEDNNDCNQDKVYVLYPDLTATKANNAAWNAGQARWEKPFDDTFNWKVTVKDIGQGGAPFFDGQVILRDYLPAGPTYGTPTVNNVVNVTNSGFISCTIASNILTCKANGGKVTIRGTFGGQPQGQFDVTVSVTPELPGWKTNPTGGVCRANPDALPWELNPGNDDCNQDKVYVIPPDLTATKSADKAMTIPTDSWTWTIRVTNVKEGKAYFPDGSTILKDDLPDVNLTYGAPSVVNVMNVTNSANISCAIVGNTLTCTASGARVTVGGLTGRFDVQFTATANDAGTFANPRAGGICKADPNNVVPEYDGIATWENNNDCNQHTVYVAVLQRDKNDYNSVLDTTISPYIRVPPPPYVPVGLGPELDVLTNDTAATLISFGLTGQITPGATVRSAALWLYVYERCNQAWWWSSKYIFGCSVNPNNASLTVSMYQILRAWNEDEATWTNATRLVKWTGKGANGIGKDRAGTASAEDKWNALGWKLLDATKLVKTWYANPAKNFGAILKSHDKIVGRLFRLYSSEYMTDVAKRPNLHIISW